MLPGQPAEVRAEQLVYEAARARVGGGGTRTHARCGRIRRSGRLQEVGSNAIESHTLQFGARVHGDHGVLVDATLQLLQRGPGLRKALRHVQPVHDQRVVAGEVRAVVLQHAQPKVVDLGVGGVDVHQVDLAGRDGVVGEAVIEAGGLLLQAIGLCKAGPAIGAADEFVRQPELQGRVPRQVGQLANAQPFGCVGAHRQRIAIVEAEGNAHAQAQRSQGVGHGLARHRLRALEDFQRDGAAVVGVEVDGARPQRLVGDGGVAQALSDLGWPGQRGACGLRQQLRPGCTTR